jgi:hypothetical protein
MTVTFRTILLMAVLVSFAACSGGIFVDPGHGGGGYYSDHSDRDSGTGGGSTGSGGGSSGSGSGSTGSGSSSKPAKLATNVSYGDARAKLEEIIDYCEDHPGTINNAIKYQVETTKNGVVTAGQNGWSSYLSSATINAINLLIDQLQ